MLLVSQMIIQFLFTLMMFRVLLLLHFILLHWLCTVHVLLLTLIKIWIPILLLLVLIVYVRVYIVVDMNALHIVYINASYCASGHKRDH